MIDSVCVMIRRAPGEEKSTLGLRASLAALNSSIETRLIFFEEGVYNLFGYPGYPASVLKEFLESEEEAYAVKEDLEGRGLAAEALPEAVKIIPRKGLEDIVEACEAVLIF